MMAPSVALPAGPLRNRSPAAVASKKICLVYPLSRALLATSAACPGNAETSRASGECDNAACTGWVRSVSVARNSCWVTTVALVLGSWASSADSASEPSTSSVLSNATRCTPAVRTCPARAAALSSALGPSLKTYRRSLTGRAGVVPGGERVIMGRALGSGVGGRWQTF